MMLRLVYNILVYETSNVTATPALMLTCYTLADIKIFNWRKQNRLVLPHRGNKEYTHLNCILYKAEWLTKNFLQGTIWDLNLFKSLRD